jgi:hypothetical protein
MEPRGCKPVAIAGKSLKPATGENKPKIVAVGCDQLPEGAHGMGRVDPTSFC